MLPLLKGCEENSLFKVYLNPKIEQIWPAVVAPLSTKFNVSAHIMFHSPRVFLLTIPLLFRTGRVFTSKTTVMPSQSATVETLHWISWYTSRCGGSLTIVTYNNPVHLLSVRSQTDRYTLDGSECKSLITDKRTRYPNRSLKMDSSLNIWSSTPERLIITYSSLVRLLNHCNQLFHRIYVQNGHAILQNKTEIYTEGNDPRCRCYIHDPPL